MYNPLYLKAHMHIHPIHILGTNGKRLLELLDREEDQVSALKSLQMKCKEDGAAAGEGTQHEPRHSC